MKKNTFFSGVVSMGLVCLFAFNGCEAGLTSGDGNGSGEDEEFSFSKMHSAIKELREEIKLLKQVTEETIESSTPIGSIQAWHKNLEETPDIPSGWVECDGRIIDDSESPYNGLAAPNLNSPMYSGNSKGLFLRGYTQSGLFEEDTFERHYHNYTYTTGVRRAKYDGGDWSAISILSYSSKQTTTVGSDETRPSSMSVVWIIKIK